MGPHNEKFRILLLDTKPSNPNHYLCLALEKAFKQHPDVEEVFRCDYSTAISTAIKNSTNFFFAFDGESPDLNICARLSEVCGRSAVWFTEDPYEVTTNIQNSKIFDVVFTNDKNSALKYCPKGRHLPLAASDYFHYHSLANEEDYLYDLLFVGTAWPNRVTFLQQLLPLLPDVKFKIALPTNLHLPTFSLPIDEAEYSWSTPNFEFARMANKARIVLSLHRDFSASGKDTLASTPGPRLFEVALAGGFQLISSQLEEVTQYYDEPSEIITFETVQDCAQKVRYFLNNYLKRRAIATKSQKKTLDRHLYKHRTEVILDTVREIKQNNQKKTALRPKPNILVVTHNTTSSATYGGVEVYQELVTSAMKEHFNFLYLVPKKIGQTFLSKSVVLLNSKYQIVEELSFREETELNNLRSEQRELYLKNILVKYKIDIVHYQHLIGHSLSLPLISKQLGIPSVLTIHDYFLACDNFNLVDYTGSFCGTSREDLSKCDTCLSMTSGKQPGYQAKRREFVNQILNSIDTIIFNTEGGLNLFLNFFSKEHLLKKCLVSPPPIVDHKFVQKKNPFKFPLKVVSLGNFTANKGYKTQIALFELCKNLPIEFHILGYVSENLAIELKSHNLKNVIVHGNFKQDSLASIVNDMHISLHLSIWPETYCLTLSESWKAGLIPIVTDIGALAERVHDQVNGFKVAVDDPLKVFNILQRIIAKPSTLAKIRSNIAPSLWQTSHISDLKQIYSNHIKATSALSASETFPVNTVGPIAAALGEINIIKLPQPLIVQLASRLTSTIRLPLKAGRYLIKHGISKTASQILKRVRNV